MQEGENSLRQSFTLMNWTCSIPAEKLNTEKQ